MKTARLEKGETEVTLTSEEVRLAKYLAAKKYQISRQGNLTYGARLDGEEDNHLQNEILGICGELAFCRMANLYPDIEITKHGKDADAVDWEGRTIDVKTSARAAARVWANGGKKTYCDYFVLIRAEDPRPADDVLAEGTVEIWSRFIFMGYATRAALVREENIKAGASGRQAYWLHKNELNNVW